MSTDEKIKGKVKWFSIRKGFGFITPSSDNATTKEDIFFHQTSIVSDAKDKFLEPEYEVEFEVYTDENGKYKSRNVTQPGGAPCQVPARRQSSRRRGKGGGSKIASESVVMTTDDEGGKEDNELEEKEEDDKGNGGEKRNNNSRGRGRDNRNSNPTRGKARVTSTEEGEQNEGNQSDDKPKPVTGGRGRRQRKRFDDDITPEVKNKMKEKKLDMRQTSLLLVVDKSRLKLGPDGYAALCHEDGIMAEGVFACDRDGQVSLTWKNMLRFFDGDWKPEDPIASASCGVLVESFNWSDQKVEGLKTIETPEDLWGDDKTDPADALQNNSFQMKKCFLSKTTGNPRNRRRPRPRGNRKGGARNNNGKTKAETEESGTSGENGKSGENGETNAKSAPTDVES